MAGRAERDQVVQVVRAALLAWHDVVHVQEVRAPASRGAAAVTVSCEHLPPHDGGMVARLGSPLRCTRASQSAVSSVFGAMGIGPRPVAISARPQVSHWRITIW